MTEGTLMDRTTVRSRLRARALTACALAAALAGAAAAPATAALPTPNAPQQLRAAAASGTASVAWDANPEPHVTGYQLQRRAGAAGSWLDLTPGPGLRTTFGDSALTNGTDYSYRVAARSVTGAVSGWSSTVTVTAGPDTTAPPAVRDVGAGAGRAGIAVRWTASPEPDVTRYEVERRSGSATWAPYTTLTTPRGVDPAVVTGIAYSYRIQAVDSTGNRSAWSSTVSATAGPDTTAPAAPTGLVAHRGDSEVTVTWTPSNEPDVFGYQVFGKQCDAPSWRYLGQARTNRFTAGWLENLTEFCVYVKAIDDSFNESSFSATARATPERGLMGVALAANADWGTAAAISSYGSLGAGEIRVEVPASADPADADPYFDDFATAGLRPFVLIGYDGSWPSTSDVRRICGGVAAMYGPGGSANLPDASAVRHIEFGNESSYSYWGTGIHTQPETYAQLLTVCAQAVQAANPNVGVLAIADDPTGQNWVSRVNARVRADLGVGVDALIAGWTAHAYGPTPALGPTDRADIVLDRALDATAYIGSGAPIFITEYGFSTDDGATLSDNYQWPVNMTYAQAATALSGMAAHFKASDPRVQQLFVYQTRDLRSPGASTDREHYFGLLKVDGSDKPSLTNAYRALVVNGGI
jgi:hypothetical protein